jgi:isoquinoline 1-oxidoreductase
MWHGKVLRAPTLGSSLTALDATAARAMADVVVVRDGDFVGVAAARGPHAARALDALKPTWKTTPQPRGEDLFTLLRKPPAQASRGERRRPHVVGSVSKGWPPPLIASTTHTVAYIAHVPLEPRAAVAVGRRSPHRLDGDAAAVRREERAGGGLSLPEEKVRVVVPTPARAARQAHPAIRGRGGAAGGRGPAGESSSGPARKKFRWAYVRPAGVIDVRSGADASGSS